MDRLEQPILDSFKSSDHQRMILDPTTQTPTRSQSKKTPLKTNTIQTPQEDSPLNWFLLPSLTVFRVDFIFTCGMYLFGLVLFSAVFRVSLDWFWAFAGFGIFYQTYLVICRSLMGATLGEERCNLGWRGFSVLRFIGRGLLVTLTGFILLPLLSILFRRNLLEDCTGLRLQYNM